MDPLASVEAEALTVCIDFKHPHAYLALPPTIAMAEALGVTVNWLPCIVAPIDEPSAAVFDEDRGVRHRRFRAEYAARDIRRYAEVNGLVIEDLYRRPDVRSAALGLLWARRSGLPAAQRYVQTVCRGHWASELDIEDRWALSGALRASGAGSDGFVAFAEGQGPAEFAVLQEVLADHRVFGVPAYLLAGQCFIGRAHLPMIRKLLAAGRERRN